MPFAALLTHDTARDRNALSDYIAANDSLQKAGHVLEQIEKTFATLFEFPERGVHPEELQEVGI